MGTLPIPVDEHAPPAKASRLIFDLRGERSAAWSQMIISGGPLVVGSLFHIGVPIYASLFGTLGKYNCLFYDFTGRPCPACGLTSSVVCTLHGRWDLALSYHPIGLAFALFIVLLFCGGCVKLAHAYGHPWRSSMGQWLIEFPPHAFVNWVAGGLLIAYCARAIFWIAAGLG